MHFFRSLAVKIYSRSLWCASCGELKVPLAGRLCTSIIPDFKVDCIQINTTPVRKEAVSKLPFINQTFICTEEDVPTLHLKEDLAEYFFVALPQSNIMRLVDALDLFTPNGVPLLNGNIAKPLQNNEDLWGNFLEQQRLPSAKELTFDSDIYACSKILLADFNVFFEAFEQNYLQRVNYLSSFSRWLYVTAQGITVGTSHPLRYLP